MGAQELESAVAYYSYVDYYGNGPARGGRGKPGRVCPQPRSGPNGAHGGGPRRPGDAWSTFAPRRPANQVRTVAALLGSSGTRISLGTAVVAVWRCAARRAGGGPARRAPHRGDKAALMDTVRKNAEEALRLHKTRRAGDLTPRTPPPGAAPPGPRLPPGCPGCGRCRSTRRAGAPRADRGPRRAHRGRGRAE